MEAASMPVGMGSPQQLCKGLRWGGGPRRALQAAELPRTCSVWLVLHPWLS